MTNKKQPINYLPLNILSRYELFLVLSDKKPSCSVEIKDDKKSYHFKIQQFLKNHKAYFAVDTENPALYFVSKIKENAFGLQKIWNLEGEEIEIKKGLLLGYPKEAAKAYAKYSKSPDRSKYLSLCIDPYGGYMIRAGYKVEDTKISQSWRQFIEKENPKLVEWLDNKINPLLKKL